MSDNAMIDIDMTFDELRALRDEAETAEPPLSAEGLGTLFSETPHPQGIPASHLTCSVDVAEELEVFAERAAQVDKADERRSALLLDANRQIRFALGTIAR